MKILGLPLFRWVPNLRICDYQERSLFVHCLVARWAPPIVLTEAQCELVLTWEFIYIVFCVCVFVWLYLLVCSHHHEWWRELSTCGFCQFTRTCVLFRLVLPWIHATTIVRFYYSCTTLPSCIPYLEFCIISCFTLMCCSRWVILFILNTCQVVIPDLLYSWYCRYCPHYH